MGDKVVDWTMSFDWYVFMKARGEIHNREHVAVFELRDDQRFRRRVSGFFYPRLTGLSSRTTRRLCFYTSRSTPIIVVNTCRYERIVFENNDLRGWKTLNGKLKELYDSSTVVSNNRADQDYLEMGTGIKSTYIPSLCEYTNAEYSPSRIRWWFTRLRRFIQLGAVD
jgi:hypothetical protein